MRRGWIFVAALAWAGTLTAAAAAGQGGYAASETVPSLLEAVRVAGPLQFCGEAVSLSTPDVRERFEKEMLLALWDRPQVILWLKRAPRYLPEIEVMLGQAGLPDDLKYLAVAESGLRPHAASRAGAVGFWQFLKATGLKYGLRIDAHVDERRSLTAATRAAAAYLQELHTLFGSWTLAAAAYNMGEDGLLAEILEQGARDYQDLYLPLETQRYLFRVLAAKLILTRPQRYGFSLAPEDGYPPVPAESVTFESGQDIPLRLVAQAAGTYFKMVKDLNPELRGHYLIAGRYMLKVPQGKAEGFDQRLAALVAEWGAARNNAVYVVRAGDNLTAIAERFEIPLALLLLWNRLDPARPIHPGQALVVRQVSAGMPATTDETESGGFRPAD